MDFFDGVLNGYRACGRSNRYYIYKIIYKYVLFSVKYLNFRRYCGILLDGLLGVRVDFFVNARV